MYDIFLCYSKYNSRFIKRLVVDLTDYGLSVSVETIEIDDERVVPDSIERGIKASRFLCLAFSPHALDAYNFRKIEFDQVFTRMISEQRESCILPIIVQTPNTPVPHRIAHLDRIDLTQSRSYTRNLRHLVDTVRGMGPE